MTYLLYLCKNGLKYNKKYSLHPALTACFGGCLYVGKPPALDIPRPSTVTPPLYWKVSLVLMYLST